MGPGFSSDPPADVIITVSVYRRPGNQSDCAPLLFLHLAIHPYISIFFYCNKPCSFLLCSSSDCLSLSLLLSISTLLTLSYIYIAYINNCMLLST